MRDTGTPLPRGSRGPGRAAPRTANPRGSRPPPCRPASPLRAVPIPTCGAPGCHAKASRWGPTVRPIGRGGEGGGARPLAVSRGGLPWTPQAPGTTKPPRKPPELGWRRRRKAGRPSAETAVCGRAARRRRWPGQLGPGGGTGSLRGHLGGATWRKGAVSHDTWPQQRLRRVQGPLCRSVTSGHGQCALPGRSHSLTRRQRRPEARQGPKRHEGVRELALGTRAGHGRAGVSPGLSA